MGGALGKGKKRTAKLEVRKTSEVTLGCSLRNPAEAAPWAVELTGGSEGVSEAGLGHHPGGGHTG